MSCDPWRKLRMGLKLEAVVDFKEDEVDSLVGERGNRLAQFHQQRV